jgi:hypothetical protein
VVSLVGVTRTLAGSRGVDFELVYGVGQFPQLLDILASLNDPWIF